MNVQTGDTALIERTTLPADFVRLDCCWFTFTHLNEAQKHCLSVIFIIYRTFCQKDIPHGKVQGVQLLVFSVVR